MLRFPYRRFISSLLAILVVLPAPAQAEGGSIASETLNGISSALGGANSFVGQYGASATQLQALATQLQGIQNQANGVQQQQSAFDQIQLQLRQSTLTAQNCVQEATHPDAFYVAKYKKAGKIAPSQIGNLEPTCKNYGTIIDQIAMLKDQMTDVNKKMSCISKLQNEVKELAEKAKAPFQQITNTAQEVWSTHESIVSTHKQIAEKIDKQLNGENGYRKRLADLKGLSLQLNDVLNGKLGEGKDGGKMGLVKQLANISAMRTSAGNQWYFDLMGDTQSCFSSNQTIPCFNGVGMAPAACIAAAINNPSSTPGTGGRNKRNQDRLYQVNLLNYGKTLKNDMPANLDVKNPDAFLTFTHGRFENMLTQSLRTFRAQSFSRGVDKATLSKFMEEKYRECYNLAVTRFRADLDSGGRYKERITAVQEAERDAANDTKNWIDRVEAQMTEFRTAFHTVYNSELPQFGSDCAADQDPVKSLDCLKVLQATLVSGIKGTRQTVRLANGTVSTVNAGETNLPIQNLSLDAQGKPVTSATSVRCSGFDDCINFLTRAQSQHEDSAEKQRVSQQKFVEQHNKVMQSSMDVVAAQFGQMSQLIVAGVNGINDELVKKLGIQARITTKSVEGEPLEIDEKTKLYKMPKNMRAALAGRNSFSEIEDTSEVTSAYNSQVTELNKKAKDAARMKNRCKIEKAEYEGLASIMPSDCSDEKALCGRDRTVSASAQLEALFKKGRERIDENESSNRSSSNSEYRSCVNELRQEAREGIDDDTELDEVASKHGLGSIYQKPTENAAKTLNPEIRAKAKALLRAEKQKELRQRTGSECGQVIGSTLAALAGQGRNATLQQQNNKLVQALRAMSDYCAADNITAAEQACDEFKKTAKSAQVPTDEDESKTPDNKTTSEMATNPIILNGTAGTNPAR